MKARGWRVFATARKPEDIAALEAAGVEALYLDYAEEASIAAAADAVLAATGGTLDVLFNNGAYGQPGALEDVPTAVLRAQFEANFFGWHDLTRRMVPAMRRQGHGRIVMCSSILGIIAMGFRGPYSCSKWALEAYADTLRIELAGSGIHVSAIEPGPIRTKFTLNALAKARENIDIEHSVHADAYRRRLRSMENERRHDGGRAGSGGRLRRAGQGLREPQAAAAIFRHAADLLDELAEAGLPKAPAPRLPHLGHQQGLTAGLQLGAAEAQVAAHAILRSGDSSSPSRSASSPSSCCSACGT